MLLRGAQQETAPPPELQSPREPGFGTQLRPFGAKGKNGAWRERDASPGCLAAAGPHERKDAESSQRGASDLARQENKITERVGVGGGAWLSRKGRGGNGRWVLARGAVLCRPGWPSSCSCSAHLRAVESTFCSAPTLSMGSNRRKNGFSCRKRAKKDLSPTEVTIIVDLWWLARHRWKFYVHDLNRQDSFLK